MIPLNGISERASRPHHLILPDEVIDQMIKDGKAEKVDYIHGGEVVARLAVEKGNSGFYLPGMNKGELFRTVILDGVLPRKTFSMGEAREKRFYMECRKIA